MSPTKRVENWTFTPSNQEVNDPEWTPARSLTDEQLNNRLKHLRSLDGSTTVDNKLVARRLDEAEKEFLSRTSKK